MTRKVGWQKEKCTAHVSQDDYAIVVVDIHAEVIAMEVEFQLRVQSQNIFGHQELFMKVVKPGLLSLESEDEFTMIPIVKREKYLITDMVAGRSRQCRPLRLSTDMSGRRVPSRFVQFLRGIDT
jgi:hypothetical protein